MNIGAHLIYQARFPEWIASHPRDHTEYLDATAYPRTIGRTDGSTAARDFRHGRPRGGRGLRLREVPREDARTSQPPDGARPTSRRRCGGADVRARGQFAEHRDPLYAREAGGPGERHVGAGGNPEG